MHAFSLRIPASTSNLGPGFDCLGLALDLLNLFHVQASKGGYVLTCEPEAPFDFSTPQHNIIIKAYESTCVRHQRPIIPFALHAELCIPMKGGLGSSATAIVAGVAIAYQQHNLGNDRLKMLEDALVLEPHPDNLAAAIFGGLIVAATHEQGPPSVFQCVPPAAQPLQLLAISPHIEVSTEASRKQLPSHYTRSDAVFNLARSTLMAAYLIQGNYRALRQVCEDKIHQPYRLKPEYQFDAFKKIMYEQYHAYAVFLSGSGPTWLVMAPMISEAMQTYVAHHFEHVPCTQRVLQINQTGIEIVQMH